MQVKTSAVNTESELSTLKSVHSAILEKASEIEELRCDIAKHASQLTAELDEAKVQYSDELSGLSTQHDAILRESILEHEGELDDLHRAHQREVQQLLQQVTDLKSHHDSVVSHHAALLDKATADVGEHEQEKESLLAEHVVALNALRADHQATVAQLRASLVTVECEHRQGLTAFREEHDTVLAQEHKRYSALVEINATHDQQRESLLMDAKLLREELTQVKTSAVNTESELFRVI